MEKSICQRYLETSVYTDVGPYRDLVLSLPDDIPSIGRLVCDQIIHPSLLFTAPSPYLEKRYYGPIAAYPKQRFRNEDELYITAVAMIAGILRLDGAGFTGSRDVTRRIAVSCRAASVLFSAMLKAKGIPCRSRAGFMDFGDAGESYMEHWVNEYWDFQGNRWVLADVDGYYEYEERFGYSQFDLPRRKLLTAAEAWLGLRRNTLRQKLDVFSPDPLEGACEYLMMDFHALMNDEIFYSYQPLYLRGGVRTLDECQLRELDELAELMLEPDRHMEQIERVWATNEKLSMLTNHTQNVYHDVFGP